MTPSNLTPDPKGPCPVCRRSWEDGKGGSLLQELTQLYMLMDGDEPGGIVAVRCPFCKTQWEV